MSELILFTEYLWVEISSSIWIQAVFRFVELDGHASYHKSVFLQQEVLQSLVFNSELATKQKVIKDQVQTLLLITLFSRFSINLEIS